MSGGAGPFGREKWLNQEAFDQLLACLDPDRDRAGQRYEQIRRKLIKFFQWRGCGAPDDCADRTIDRVARRIEQGLELPSGNQQSFFHGVAVNVLREYWRERDRQMESLEEPAVLHRAASASGQPPDGALECMRQCMNGLSKESRRLVVAYHEDRGRARIEARQELAETLGIPLNALRIRVFRIRASLESCVERCFQAK